MNENRHNSFDLEQMQSLPLEAKIRMTQQRIKQWYEYFDGQVYVSFSGGKDSTVLKHIVDSMYSDVPAIFVNTGLEYPEIQKFARDIKEGKYDCFNSDVEILRPEMRFDEVIKNIGYPVATKRVSQYVSIARRNPNSICKKYLTGEKWTITATAGKWVFLLDAPFKVSDKCCGIMKKKPLHLYENKTGRKPYLGTMADESLSRKMSWIKNGCNAFDSRDPSSQPLSFWTEQDILEYIVKYNVPYASVYGNIVEDGELEGQTFLDGFHSKLKTTGCSRTGCMFCMFGCHLEKEPNRFQRMKETHPNQYDYCMKSIDDGGLGLKDVIDWMNENGNLNIRY